VNTTRGGEGNLTETEVLDNEAGNSCRMFKNMNVNDQIIEADRVNNILAAIAKHSMIDPWTLSGDEPQDWEDLQC
jgi:hypothetical protein